MIRFDDPSAPQDFRDRLDDVEHLLADVDQLRAVLEATLAAGDISVADGGCLLSQAITKALWGALEQSHQAEIDRLT